MIEVNNLSFRYKESQPLVLDNISLKIEDKKWISIIGHNGSGKSTFAKALVGLLTEFEGGTITIDGMELNKDNVDKIRKELGIVFQNPDNQFVGITVKNDIAFGLENRMTPREEIIRRVDEALEKIDMVKYKDQEPYKLSGGQKQKAAVGGTLACDLKYIIFDEATSMLDPRGSNEIIKLIKELKEKENKTIITITHDLNLAKLSDYIYVFQDGKVSFEGKPHDVFMQKEILERSNINQPLELKLYHEILNDPKLNQDEKLKDVLWKLSLKM